MSGPEGARQVWDACFPGAFHQLLAHPSGAPLLTHARPRQCTHIHTLMLPCTHMHGRTCACTHTMHTHMRTYLKNSCTQAHTNALTHARAYMHASAQVCAHSSINCPKTVESVPGSPLSTSWHCPPAAMRALSITGSSLQLTPPCLLPALQPRSRSPASWRCTPAAERVLATAGSCVEFVLRFARQHAFLCLRARSLRVAPPQGTHSCREGAFHRKFGLAGVQMPGVFACLQCPYRM